jgi:hypothetical protein
MATHIHLMLRFKMSAQQLYYEPGTRGKAREVNRLHPHSGKVKHTTVVYSGCRRYFTPRMNCPVVRI